MPQERRSPQPQGVYIFDAVRVQALAQLHHRIQTPLTITRKFYEYEEKIGYVYQVGTPTKEHPVGIATGLQKTFLGALERGIEATLKYENSEQSRRRSDHEAREG